MTRTLAGLAIAAVLGLTPLAASAHGGHRDCDEWGHRHHVHHHHHHRGGDGYGYRGGGGYGYRGYPGPVAVYPAPVYSAPRVAQVYVPPVTVALPLPHVRIGF